VTLPQVPPGRCCGRFWAVMVLVVQTDAPSWDSWVFEGIGDVDVEAVSAAFGTVEVVARGREAGAVCPLRADGG
jgi:hypothetical protein